MSLNHSLMCCCRMNTFQGKYFIQNCFHLSLCPLGLLILKLTDHMCPYITWNHESFLVVSVSGGPIATDNLVAMAGYDGNK